MKSHSFRWKNFADENSVMFTSGLDVHASLSIQGKIIEVETDAKVLTEKT